MVILRYAFIVNSWKKVTIKNEYPIPRINKLYDQLQQARFFLKIDLRPGHQRLKVRECDILEVTFKTWYGHYELSIMSFGLTNFALDFFGLMYNVFKQHLDMFFIMFINDILIYSCNEDEHVDCLNIDLKIFKDRQLFDKFRKC